MNFIVDKDGTKWTDRSHTDFASFLDEDDAKFTAIGIGELLQLDGSTETSRASSNNHNIGLVRKSFGLGGILLLLLGIVVVQTGQGLGESADSGVRVGTSTTSIAGNLVEGCSGVAAADGGCNGDQCASRRDDFDSSS